MLPSELFGIWLKFTPNVPKMMLKKTRLPMTIRQQMVIGIITGDFSVGGGK